MTRRGKCHRFEFVLGAFTEKFKQASDYDASLVELLFIPHNRGEKDEST